MDAQDRFHLRRTPWVVALIGSVLLLSACTTPQASAPSPAVNLGGAEVREGGQVTVAVSWNGPSAGARFGVVMDTHSVDLDAIDLPRRAVLRTPTGELAATSWEAPRGGHHRSGELVFPDMLPNGQSTIGTGPVELVIRDVAGIPERAFRWQP